MTCESLVEAYRRLGQAGLIAGSSGNISLRSVDGMLISPSGTSPERIAPGDVVEMRLDSPEPGASSEWALHGCLYAARPDIGAIVHTHADACTALACLNEPLPAFHYDVLAFGGPVRCAPYVTFGTPELAALAVQAMQGRTACLLANHGMITAGPTIDIALAAAFQLERLCRQYLLARSAGAPRLLTADEQEAARQRFRTYGAPRTPAPAG
jgi:L-fuculose-phosphate aldolase